jgi:predicted ATPase
MGELSLTSYEILRTLGRGAAGVVYEALDQRTNALVALKTIAEPIAENVYRLKQEFRALADVQHPNLVRLGELSQEDGQWYFTMEVVHGETFIAHVRPGARDADASSGVLPAAATHAPGDVASPLLDSSVHSCRGHRRSAPTAESLDEARLRSALPQLVSALRAIHEAGHVHRDVKPPNVLVSDEGRLVLLDFGLVATLASGGRSGDDRLSGTPAFMAPEQVEGGTIGPAADFYAVGVMLYLALTGTLPFDGSMNEILEAKLLGEAPSARSIAPHAAEDLVALSAALLRRNPAERPAADAIARALGMTPEKAERGPDSAPVFVGREEELERLRRVFDDVRAHRGRIVVVEGEPGIGKSTVVQRFLGGVGPGVTILAGRCYEQETVPFKGIDSILDALSEHLVALADDRVESLIEGGVRYLAAVFPVLNRVAAIAAATSHERGVENASLLRDQAFGEFERLVHALADRGPVILFLDDLQWADGDSIALLQRTLSGRDGARALFVATLRAGADLAPETVELMRAGERIRLEGLSDTQSRTLWEALWPAHSKRRTSAESRDSVMREAAGHPLFLAELARSARAGHLDRFAGLALQDVLWQHVIERDDTDRRFLEMVALAGAPTPLDVVARAAELSASECATRLGALRAAQLVRVSRRGDERLVEPYHDRVRESVLSHLAQDGSATMEQRHARLGRALLDGASDDVLGQRVFVIVQHLNAARAILEDPHERLRLAALNLRANREARLATAYQKARDYSRVGLELVGAGAWSHAHALTRDLHVAQMSGDFLAGDHAAARACFEVARAHLTSREERTDLSVEWIALETGSGNSSAAISAGRDILVELGAPLPSRAMMLSVLVQYVRNRIVQRGRESEELLHLPLLESARHESISKILIALSPPAFFCDSNLLTWILLRIAAIAMRHGVSNVSAYGFAGYGAALSAAFGKHAEGAAFGRLAMALNERFGNAALAAKIHLLHGGWIVSWVRPFAEGKELLRAGQQLALKNGDISYECYCASLLSVLTFCESRELRALSATAEWAEAISVRRQERDMAGVPAAHARYAAAMRAGSVDLGSPESSDAAFRASMSDATTPTAMFYYFFCSAELAYHAGDTARARALLADAKRRTQPIFGLPTTVELHFLDALVAAREHDQAGLTARLGLRLAIAAKARKLRAWARSCSSNFSAHLAIVEGELARVRGRAAQARRSFERAVTAARAHDDTKRESLALELTAAHERASGDAVAAARAATEASRAYLRWGTEAKATAVAHAFRSSS